MKGDITMKKLLKIVGIAAAVAALAVLVLGAVAFAQGPPGGPWFRPFGGRLGHFPFFDNDQAEAYREQMQEALTNALGLSVEELDAARDEGKSLLEIAEEQGVDVADVEEAMKAASEQLLDQAVADGLLTQEQADSVRQRWQGMADRGHLGMRGGFPGRPAGRGVFPFADPDQAEAYREQTQEALANALGLSVEELDAARDEGKSLLEIAEEQGIDMADVQEAMRAAGEQLIDQAVADGLLTQEQADTIRQRVDEVPGPGGMRRGYGFHRMPGWRGRKAH